jgi:hypothetical protein
MLWQTLEQWWNSIVGKITMIGAGLTTIYGAFIGLVKFSSAMKRIYANVAYLMEIQGMLQQIMDMVTVDREIRSGMMDEDEKKLFFRCDSSGRFEWGNRLFREITSLDMHELTRYG